jgi:fumarate hydratase class II
MAKDSATRIELDTMGEVAVPASRYWGAQTQRSLKAARRARLRLSAFTGKVARVLAAGA